jgi:hypothetical protein
MQVRKYTILIVDENDEQIDDFKNFIESLSNEIDVVGINSLKDDDELINIVNETEADAVAFDYKLKEGNSAFVQNGDAYLNILLDNFENFPTFIITNNTADSKSMKADPFKIIDKSVVHFDPENDAEVHEGAELIQKITQSIDTYRENITSYENELYELIQKQSAGLKLSEEELIRMVDLDTNLENSISKRSKIPKEWKSPAAIEEIVSLVTKSAQILDELKRINK